LGIPRKFKPSKIPRYTVCELPSTSMMVTPKESSGGIMMVLPGSAENLTNITS